MKLKQRYLQQYNYAGGGKLYLFNHFTSDEVRVIAGATGNCSYTYQVHDVDENNNLASLFSQCLRVIYPDKEFNKQKMAEVIDILVKHKLLATFDEGINPPTGYLALNIYNKNETDFNGKTSLINLRNDLNKIRRNALFYSLDPTYPIYYEQPPRSLVLSDTSMLTQSKTETIRTKNEQLGNVNESFSTGSSGVAAKVKEVISKVTDFVKNNKTISTTIAVAVVAIIIILIIRKRRKQ